MKLQNDTDYLHAWIAQGEHQQQDFKFEISDARKIARSLSAFANTNGGRLLVGVKDNGRLAGIRSEEDWRDCVNYILNNPTAWMLRKTEQRQVPNPPALQCDHTQL